MAHGIPPGWEVMTSRSKGLDYYFNKKSGKQYWVHKDLPQGWSKIIEADRRTYYFHISDEMGTRSYEKPAAVASAPLSPPPQPHHIHAPSVNESTNPHFSHPPQRRGSNSLHDLLSPVAASVASPEEQYHHTAPQRDKRPREDVESPRSESKHIRRDVASCDRRSSPPRNTREMEPAWATSRPTPAESSTSRSLVTDGTDQEQAAQFYSKLSRKKTSDRADSRLYHMRCMNNWVKSVLIQEYSQKQSRVLDLACGKGGDMNKWARHNFQMYMGVDIALGSLEDAATRIQQNADLSRSDIHLVRLPLCLSRQRRMRVNGDTSRFMGIWAKYRCSRTRCRAGRTNISGIERCRWTTRTRSMWSRCSLRFITCFATRPAQRSSL
ncbi:hypothetical protein, variant 3 [Aphanomyces invadans]|uniref:mRNA (guanine-N(7))-methyltransferase n=1 Tax=Aphanomyces invadans TaxID=157072 RepID=A0A024TWG4_9STRA|nr:hypothetical protein, variant 2 [Aphanomyces invadans]XP_008873233.1 hypothetical protein, variant 3 [Aphanomyces invadans]ETV98357.1 hypothetical protein, variant 2 [Aphanomyces invadans]ETV98358.1 hypothetical protein, variant 3 [Aphanomyces invadans]|eukprot:XP_008873232.1 hypothetical protein, variant 2 [Aphanomyces invadans]